MRQGDGKSTELGLACRRAARRGRPLLIAAHLSAAGLCSAGGAPLGGDASLPAETPSPLLKAYIISNDGKTISPRNTAELRKNDGRFELSLAETKLGLKLTEQQAAELKACVGTITCPTRFGRNQETAFSVLKPDLLLTAKHGLFPKDGRGDVLIKRCTFRSFSGRTPIPVSIDRDAAKPGFYFNNFDYLLVRLKTPLAGCNSFALDETGAPAHEGDQFITVSGRQRGMLNAASGREPIVARGTVRQAFYGAFNGPSIYWTDVDLSAGGSGGAVLSLDEKGQLVTSQDGRPVLKGIAVATGIGAKDGQPYRGDMDRGNQSIFIGADATLLKAALRARDKIENGKIESAADIVAPRPAKKRLRRRGMSRHPMRADPFSYN